MLDGKKGGLEQDKDIYDQVLKELEEKSAGIQRIGQYLRKQHKLKKRLLAMEK